MNKNITLEFSKQGQSSNDIGTEDAFEIGLQATEYLRCLGFLASQLNLEDLDKDVYELNSYAKSFGEMVLAFSTQAFWMLEILETHRKETEVKSNV